MGSTWLAGRIRVFLTEVGQALSVIGIAFGALLVLLGGKVLLDLASKEIQSRLSDLPLLILRVARWRLPRDLRESVHDDWRVPDLQERLQREDDRPITRLLKGLHFAVSLVIKAGCTARAAGAPSTAARMWKAMESKLLGFSKGLVFRLLTNVVVIFIAMRLASERAIPLIGPLLR